MAMLCLAVFNASSAVAEISPEAELFAKRFRSVEPLLVQDIVVSPDKDMRGRVFLLTQPPARAFRSQETWLPEIFGRAGISNSERLSAPTALLT